MKIEPPTERQLSYAQDLGILIPNGATKNDVSNLIDMKLDNDKPATDRHRSLAKIFGVEPPSIIGKKALFDLIQYNLVKPGKEKEMLSWFAYRVYRELVHGDDDAAIAGPSDPAIQNIVAQLENNKDVIKSVRRYAGRDLIWFGTFTSSDGYTHNGGSNRTAAYKKINALLKQSLGNAIHKPTRNTNVERSINRQPEQQKTVGTLPGLLKGLGWGSLIFGFLLAALLLISGCAGTAFKWSDARKITPGMITTEATQLIGTPNNVTSRDGILIYVWANMNMLTGETRTLRVDFRDNKAIAAPPIPDSFKD